MKAQFVPDGLRIRVDPAEFEQLREHGRLQLALPGAWRVQLRVAAAFAVVQDGATLAVDLPADALAGLAARLPSREGIAGRVDCAGRPVDLAFEVDLLGGRPRRPR